MKEYQEERASLQRMKIYILSFLLGLIQILFGQSSVNFWTSSAWSLGKDRLRLLRKYSLDDFWKYCHYLDTDFLVIFSDISGHNHLKISLAFTLKYIFLALLVCYMKVGAKNCPNRRLLFCFSKIYVFCWLWGRPIGFWPPVTSLNLKMILPWIS